MSRFIAVAVFLILLILVILTQTTLPKLPQTTPTPSPSPGLTAIPTSPRSKSLSPSNSPTSKPSVTPGSSFPVSGANQLANSCFDGPHNGNPLVWIEAPPGGWDVSANKNPCGPNKTAARLNDPSLAGQSQPNVHEYIYQVVPGQGTQLTAQMACIQHFAIIGDTNIYGGPTSSGPWALVWQPFTLSDCAESTVDDRGWKDAKQSQITLPQSYPYYKFEFHAMRDADGGGIKFTSAFFLSQ